MPGKVAAFAHYGAVLNNVQWSWSAKTPSEEVVLTFWQDLFNYKTKPVSYSVFDDPTINDRKNSHGNIERIENLKWARDNCSGRLRVVVVNAVDPKASPRKIKSAYPRDNIIMKLIELNEETGEFRAEMLPSS